MTTPTFDNIFGLFYTLYRAEATSPLSSDDEYTIAMRLANEALARWATYDNTFWRDLFTTAQTDTSGGGTLVVTAGTRSYQTNTNFKEAGGFVKVQDASGGNGNTLRIYPILEPQEAQFRGDDSAYAYFTTDGASGHSYLHLNPAPDTAIDGKYLDYVYYKVPTEYTTGGTRSECPNAEYIVHRMLANRFRASRNPYYQSAMEDAEDALRIMKMANDSGSWANPWSLADNSGTSWGI